MLRLAFAVLLSWIVVAPLHAQQSNTYIWVSLDAPANGAVYTAPATVVARASAGTIDDAIYVKSVAILFNGTQVALVNGESATYTVSGLQPGTYTFQARATNNVNKVASTGTQTITVIAAGEKPPTISLRAPSGQPFIGPANVGLSADAADPDGVVTKVEYFSGAQLIGSSTTAPYNVTWAGVGPGTYSVTGRATDNNGKQTTSAPVQVSVAQSVIRGSVQELTLGANGIYHLKGWACSSGWATSVDVHVYLGGAYGTGQFWTGGKANLASDTSVAAACSASGSAYRFDFAVDMTVRQQFANRVIYVHGISPAGASNDLIGNSGTFRIPPPLAASRHYVYDGEQRLCKIIEPETGATVMDYDAVGNLLWQAAGLNLPDAANCNRAEAYASGRRVDRTWTKRNRLNSLEFPGGDGNQYFTYTPDGKPSQVVTFNGNGANMFVNGYAYNRRGLLTSETTQEDGISRGNLGYAYDGNANLARLDYPSGLQVEYAPNALGQATTVRSTAGKVFASGIRYYPNGAASQFSYGNGVVHTLALNARQMPAQVTDAGVQAYSYTYDANGNVGAINDLQQGTTYNRVMTYDALDRLATASSGGFGGDGVFRYSYDALDNLRSVALGGVRQDTYLYDASNRLASIRNAAGATTMGLAYDVQGNLSNRNGQLYRFDTGNRLREVTGKATYRYDAQGRRYYASRTGQGEQRSIYNQAGQLMYETRADQGTFEYIHLNGSLLATRKDGSTITYQHTDALGSPVATTNESAGVVERTRYEPYGAAIGKTVDGVGYTGHVMDGGTGLTYMQQRYYDPQLGAFLSVDPVTAYEKPLTNFCRFCYAMGNPYKFSDLDGRDATWVQHRDGTSTLVINILASGSGSNDALKSQIESATESLSMPRSDVRIDVRFVDVDGKGVNRLDLSPGNAGCKDSGCVNKLGGKEGHADSSRADAVAVAKHEILHFAGIDDAYVEGPPDANGNRTNIIKPGYDKTNIMASRLGSSLKVEQLDEAKANRTTKVEVEK